MFKRLLSVLLAILMLTAMFACSDGKTSAETDAGAKDTPETPEVGEETEAPDMSAVLELPEVNYNGEAVNFLVSTGTNWGNENIIAPELTGEVINDAMYNRNIAVEDMLGVKINQIDCDYKEMQSSVEAAVSAGTHDYDIVMPRLFYYAALAQGGMLLDTANLTYVKPEKVWWDQNIRRDLPVLGRLYALAGDMHMYANDATWIMLFSKDLYNDLGFNDTYGSLYGIVRDGKWTFDKMIEIMKDVSADTDGDGKLTEKDRIAHLAANNNPIFAFISAADQSVYVRDGEDIKLNIASDGFIKAVDKVITIMTADYMTLNTYSCAQWGNKAGTLKGNNAAQKAIFGENRVLFRSEVLDVVDQYTDIDVDFGIIPYPKYDEAQKQYTSIIIPDVVVTSVPMDCDNTDMVSTVLEAMAAVSHDTLRTAYYDVSLTRKNAHDEESGEMLDIIFSNRMYMFDMVFDWGGLKTKIIESVNAANNDMATIAAESGEQVKNEIAATLEAFRTNAK